MKDRKFIKAYKVINVITTHSDSLTLQDRQEVIEQWDPEAEDGGDGHEVAQLIKDIA